MCIHMYVYIYIYRERERVRYRYRYRYIDMCIYIYITNNSPWLLGALPPFSGSSVSLGAIVVHYINVTNNVLITINTINNL